VSLERLLLEVTAKNAGLEVRQPSVAEGFSGVSHRFTLLVSSGTTTCGIDHYDQLDEIGVLGAFIKRLDTGIPVVLITNKKAGDLAIMLANEYGIEILDMVEGRNFLSSKQIILAAGR